MYKIEVIKVTQEQQDRLDTLEQRVAEARIRLDRTTNTKDMVEAVSRFNYAIGEYRDYRIKIYGK